MPSIKKDHLETLERAAFALGQIVEETDPCRYEGTGCVTHDLEMVRVGTPDGVGEADLVCPVALARNTLGLDPLDVVSDPAADRPQVAIRIGPGRRTIEVDGRAWHLVGHADGSLVLGDETHTNDEIAARTGAMLDAVIAWHDVRRAFGSGFESESIAADELDEAVEAWREVAGR